MGLGHRTTPDHLREGALVGARFRANFPKVAAGSVVQTGGHLRRDTDGNAYHRTRTVERTARSSQTNRPSMRLGSGPD